MVAHRQMYDENREEPYHIAGDPDQGFSSQINLNENREAEVNIRYKDKLLTVDVYRPTPTTLAVHMICPRCFHSLWIPSDKKTIDWDAKSGRLGIEPFQCTWELAPTDGTADRRIDFGIGLCRWSVGVDNNIARDA